jgi:hypothetical protein
MLLGILVLLLMMMMMMRSVGGEDAVALREDGKVWDCNRPWPQLELFVLARVNNWDYHRRYEAEMYFFRSLFLFWPLVLSNTSLNVLVDAELAGTQEYNEMKGTLEEMRWRFPGGVKLSHLPLVPYAYKIPAHRQQHAVFWVENFTESEYVGFADTDCVFYTYIDREDLFEDGKPVVNGRSGLHKGADGWASMPWGTYRALGILEPMRCMSYFPVVVKTAHIREIRDHISKYHNKPFDQAFYENISDIYQFSQFGIICTYLFTFHRDEYKWYIHTTTPDWDGKNPPPHAGQDGNLSMFTKEMYFPKPRVATHGRYRGRDEMNIMFNEERLCYMFQRGICISPPLNKTDPVEVEICGGHYSTTPNFRDYFDEQYRFGE